MEQSSRTSEQMVPVLYLDLDGTVRHGKDELGHFVNGPKDVVIFDGAAELITRYKLAGWRVIAVSNQGGVALGFMTMNECVASMLRTQVLVGEQFDKIMFCTHHPDALEQENAVCWCRKPKPGLIIEGALSLAKTTGEIYPPHLGLMVGDRPEDEEAAKNTGLQFLEASHWRAGHHANTVL